MDHIFQTLSQFALDPFQQLAAAGNPERALREAGLTAAEARRALDETMLDGLMRSEALFDSCDTCMDPGDDPYPEVDSTR